MQNLKLPWFDGVGIILSYVCTLIDRCQHIPYVSLAWQAYMPIIIVLLRPKWDSLFPFYHSCFFLINKSTATMALKSTVAWPNALTRYDSLPYVIETKAIVVTYWRTYLQWYDLNLTFENTFSIEVVSWFVFTYCGCKAIIIMLNSVVRKVAALLVLVKFEHWLL